MSKLVAFLVAGVGASSVSVGGTFLLKSQTSPKNPGQSTPTENGGGTTDNTQTNPSPQAPVDFPKDLAAFKTSKGDTCSQSLFESLEFDSISSGAKDFKDSDSNLTGYFGTTPASDATAENTKGCLFINWEKTTTTSNDKWKGTFTWSWSFIHKDKGFMVFSVAKTSDTEQKLDLTGGAYLLTKENNNWKITHNKEVGTNDKKQIGITDLSKFPKANSGLNIVKGNDGDYWGFVDPSNSKTICGADCTGTVSNYSDPKKLSWKWSTGGDTKKIGEWCDKLDWFDHIYDATSLKLNEKLESFKGTWSAFSNPT